MSEGRHVPGEVEDATAWSATFRCFSDAVVGSLRAVQSAKILGFADRDAWCVGIAVSELMTNAIKFARGGRIDVRRAPGVQSGIEIVVEDQGPGIANVEQALADGFSEGAMRSPDSPPSGRRSLGSGLGAVVRMMDDVRFESLEPRGLRVVAVRLLDRGPRGASAGRGS